MAGKQLGFPGEELAAAQKRSKSKKILAEMGVVVPWQELIDLIEPHCPRASKKGSQPPHPLTMMLRAHLQQQWVQPQ